MNHQTADFPDTDPILYAALIQVFPAYRRQGFGTELECFMIARMLAEGLIPYCQVEFGNHRSLCLQRRLGMTIPDAHIYWLC